MQHSLIYDLLVILAAGLVASLVCRWLRVSVLLGYLLVGVLLGDGNLGWIHDENHQLEDFAEAGVFLLLFTIGLEFSLDDLRSLGRKLVIGGSVQMLLVAIPVMLVLLATSMPFETAFLIGVATSFSSTVLVFKALSEWGQTSLPHGRRAVGILLFQDAALVPLLLLVPLLTGAGETTDGARYVWLALTSVLFVVTIIALRTLLAKWMIPLLARFRSPEMVILFTLVALGGVTLGAFNIGLPPAVGAFSAGLIFNGNRWTKQIDALILPFRETFAAIFFVGLGLIFDPRLVWNEPLWMFGCLLAMISVKALAATIALRLTGLAWRAAWGMGIGLAHVGEFAFVLTLLGLDANVLSEQNYQRIVAIAVGSLILTPLLLKLGLSGIRDQTVQEGVDLSTAVRETSENRATVIGAGPIGRQVASQLETVGKDACLIDFSSINLHPFAQEGFRTIAGDATDRSVLRLAYADQAAITAVCVPDDETALRVVRVVKELNPDGFILVRCRFQSNVSKLRSAGADAVVSEEAEATSAILKTLARIASSGQ